MLDRRDLEPVFFAPFVSSLMRVEPGWIDYNGHLNMAYYNVMMDRAIDEMWLQLGIVSDEAAQIAMAGGLDVVMDRCLMVEAMTRGIAKNADA